MAKTVWILNHYAEAPNGSGGTRHFSLARTLKRHGWNAIIFAASTEHNSGRQRFSSRRTVTDRTYSDVRFLWIRTPEYQGSGVMRMLNMLSFSLQVLRPMVTSDMAPPDVIVGSSVHPFAALAASILARKYKVPFIFEVRDLWPQTLIEMGRVKDKGFTATWMRCLERLLYKRASKVITLLPYAHEYICRYDIDLDKIVWLPNGVDLTDYAASTKEHANVPFTLMYFGAHGPANGLDNLIEAVAILRKRGLDRQFTLRMIGAGTSKQALAQLVAKYQLDNVTFEDPIPKAAIPTVAAQADGFIICINDLPGLYRYGISMNKIYDYMAASRPVIIATSARNNPIREAGAGLTVAPHDSHELADAIVTLIEMPLERRVQMGQAGRTAVEQQFSYDHLGARLSLILEHALVAEDNA